jgi:hypothetical protein
MRQTISHVLFSFANILPKVPQRRMWAPRKFRMSTTGVVGQEQGDQWPKAQAETLKVSVERIGQ